MQFLTRFPGHAECVSIERLQSSPFWKVMNSIVDAAARNSDNTARPVQDVCRLRLKAP